MSKLACLFVGMFAALMLAGGNANRAMAQEKATEAPLKDERKVLIEDDKVIVIEHNFKPGAESENKMRPYRVIRALKGGTLQRIYPDGKKQTTQWKTGEVKILAPSQAYIVKNVGDTDVLLYEVLLK
jgi:hypothetical protein